MHVVQKLVLILNVGSAVLALIAALFWYRASRFPKDVHYDLGEWGSTETSSDPDEFHNVMESAARNNSRGALAAAAAAGFQGISIFIGLL